MNNASNSPSNSLFGIFEGGLVILTLGFIPYFITLGIFNNAIEAPFFYPVCLMVCFFYYWGLFELIRSFFGWIHSKMFKSK